MRQSARTCTRREPVPIASRTRRPSLLYRLRSLIVDRYRGLPPWVLLAQIFLAAGWHRAAAAHGFAPQWWDGSEITGFRAEHHDASIEWYRLVMLDGPVASWPIVIAVVVFLAQVVVGTLLALNVRPLLALAIGAGLNVNFVLAGAVNPSVFYLIIGAALALWHVEASVGPVNARRSTLVSTLVAAILLGALVPEIATVDPAYVIDDPAMVLSFVALLWVLGLWVSVGSEAISPRWVTLGGHTDNGTVPGGTTPPASGPATSAVRTARCAHISRAKPVASVRLR